MSRILGYVSSWLDSIPETEQDWIQKLEELKSTERRAGWEFARWLQWGCRHYSRTVEDIAFQVGYSPHTLQNILSAMNNSAAQVAQALDLTISHAMEVLGLDDDEKIALLTEAAENAWSPSKLRFMVNQQRLTSLITAGNAIGSAPLHDNPAKVETYQGDANKVAAPLCFVCRERNATLFAADGRLLCAECCPPPALLNQEQDDDVPFSHAPLAIDIAEPVKPFEVAEYIINKWGKQFATEVAGEVSRWW